MPYLSRIWLNPLRRDAQRLMANPQHTHAAVLGGIAAQPVTERVLWRLNRATPHRAEILVLSRSRPSWEHLVEQAGWPNADEEQARVADYQRLLDLVHLGREFRFRLRANPTSATRNPAHPTRTQKERLGADRPRGVVVAHRTAEHQLAWITAESRLPSWGFELTRDEAGAARVALSERDDLSFSKGDAGARTRVSLTTATYDGVLRVSDADLARGSLIEGVGRGRAYGCGLITLAPLTPSEL